MESCPFVVLHFTAVDTYTPGTPPYKYTPSSAGCWGALPPAHQHSAPASRELPMHQARLLHSNCVGDVPLLLVLLCPHLLTEEPRSLALVELVSDNQELTMSDSDASKRRRDNQIRERHALQNQMPAQHRPNLNLPFYLPDATVMHHARNYIVHLENEAQRARMERDAARAERDTLRAANNSAQDTTHRGQDMQNALNQANAAPSTSGAPNRVYNAVGLLPPFLSTLGLSPA